MDSRQKEPCVWHPCFGADLVGEEVVYVDSYEPANQKVRDLTEKF